MKETLQEAIQFKIEVYSRQIILATEQLESSTKRGLYNDAYAYFVIVKCLKDARTVLEELLYSK